MCKEKRRNSILNSKTALGIELGSTRIKAVLVDEENVPIATGSNSWENQYQDGIWTYSLEAVWQGIEDCYRHLAGNVKSSYGGLSWSASAVLALVV